MFSPLMKTMEHLPLVCLCLLTWSGITSAAGNDVVRVVVEEDSDAILPCSLSTKEDLRSKLFDWKTDDQKVFTYNAGILGSQDVQFKGRVSHFEDELKHGDASIKIINTKLSDSGNYSCIFPLLQPSETFIIQLVVDAVLKDRSKEISGAAKPSVTAHKTEDGVMLQCEVQGASPKPEVEWRDSDGNIVHAEEPQGPERGGSYDIILKAIVTKTDNYSCVVTQEEIKHQTEAETYVQISDVVGVVVKEGSEAILPCFLSTKEDLRSKLFDWKKDDQDQVFLYNGGIFSSQDKFKGRVSHFEDDLEHGDASIKITNTNVSDSGVYSCILPNLQPRQTFLIKLDVVTDVVRVVVKEDSEAILNCSLSTKEDLRSNLFDWKKDDQEVFLYDHGNTYNNGRSGQDQQFKGRVSHFEDELEHGDASIKIINTTLSDSGVYRCIFPRLQQRQTFYIELVVVTDVVRVEDWSDAILPCSLSTKKDLTSSVFEWTKDDQEKVFKYKARRHSNEGLIGQDDRFKGRVSHFEDKLKDGDASIKIRKTNVSDSGVYSCIFPLLQPRQTFYIQLVVERVLKDRSGEKEGAAPVPFVKTLNQTKNWALLQCEVRRASPKPKVEWRDSAGNIAPAEEPQVKERGGSYNITLKAKVTKTDNYHCVVTQKEIGHQTEAETFVYISGSHTGWIVAVVFLIIALVAVVIYFKCFRRRVPGQQNQSSPDDPPDGSSPKTRLNGSSEDVV